MKRHTWGQCKPNKYGIEQCQVCGATRDWVKRTGAMKGGKNMPYCEEPK